MAEKLVIFATDFSPASALALDVAISLARSRNLLLLIVHVFPGEPTARLGPFYASLPDPNIPPLARQLVQDAPMPADVPCEHRLLAGDPADEIVRVAQQESAAMIVMGTHGRTGAKRLLMGSVAEAVLRHARCPVLTCRDLLQTPVTDDIPGRV